MRNIDNDEGISYGIIAVFVFVFGAALIYIIFTPMLEAVLGQVNVYILDGDISYQTQGMISWNVAMFTAVPVFALIGILIWAYIRAIEGREGGM